MEFTSIEPTLGICIFSKLGASKKKKKKKEKVKRKKATACISPVVFVISV